MGWLVKWVLWVSRGLELAGLMVFGLLWVMKMDERFRVACGFLFYFFGVKVLQVG